MKEYRYRLEKYDGPKSKHICPSCGKKTFVLYVDTQTNEYIGDDVGRCDRLVNCGYHKPPRVFFEENQIFAETKPQKKRLEVPENQRVSVSVSSKPRMQAETETSYIDKEIMLKTLSQYDKNNLFLFIESMFGFDKAIESAKRYFLGTSKYKPGATVFWQVDRYGNVRTGKIMLYDYQTGKRDKKTFQFAHNLINGKDFNLKQCFFGEHLLAIDKNKTVAIVESEKTAIIASIYFDKFIWLATGGKEGLNSVKCEALKDRNVVLFPDLSPETAKNNVFSDWTKKANELIKPVANTVIVSDFLEKNADDTAKNEGLDIADYIIGFVSVSTKTRGFTETETETNCKSASYKAEDIGFVSNGNNGNDSTNDLLADSRVKMLYEAFDLVPVTEFQPEPETETDTVTAIQVVADMVRKWGGRIADFQAEIELPARLKQANISISAKEALRQAVECKAIYYASNAYRLEPVYAFSLVNRMPDHIYSLPSEQTEPPF